MEFFCAEKNCCGLQPGNKKAFHFKWRLESLHKKTGMKISLGKNNGPKIIMFKAAEDFNPLRNIDVEWDCCMAVGFNPLFPKPSTKNNNRKTAEEKSPKKKIDERLRDR